MKRTIHYSLLSLFLLFSGCATAPSGGPQIAPGVPLPKDQRTAASVLRAQGYTLVENNASGIVASKEGGEPISPDDAPLLSSMESLQFQQMMGRTGEYQRTPRRTVLKAGFTNARYNGTFSQHQEGGVTKR